MTNTPHGTSAGWHTGCRCTPCRQAHSDTQRAFGRARAQQRLPPGLRQQLLDAIYEGKPFRTVLRELNLTFITRTSKSADEARRAWIDTYEAEWPAMHAPTAPPRPLASGTGWGRVGNRVVVEDGLGQTYSISWRLGADERVEWLTQLGLGEPVCFSRSALAEQGGRP